MRPRVAIALIAAVLAWMSLLGFRGLDRPGLGYDECSFLLPLLSPQAPYAVARLGASGPVVMHSPDLGGLKSWFYAPYVNHLQNERAAGRGGAGPFISPRAIRLPMVFVALAGAALAVAAAWLLLGPREASLAAWLLALDPAVLHFVREDANASALSFLFRAAVLALSALHLRRRDWGCLYLAAFVAGLGVWTDAEFALFLAALLLAARLARLGDGPDRSAVGVNRAGVAAAFVLGAAPALVYWTTHIPEVVAFAHNRTIGQLPLGPPWSFRVATMFDSLRGLYPVYTYLGQENLAGKMSLAPVWFIAGAAFLLWRRLGARERAPAALSFTLLLFAAQAVVLFVSWPGQLFALSPAFHLALAGLAVYFLDHAFASPRARRLGTILLLAPMLATSLATSVSAERTLDYNGGGRRMWSARIAQLAEEIHARPSARFVVLDWGMANQADVLLGGFDYEEVFWRLTDWTTPPARDSLDNWIRDPYVVFVCHAPRREVFSNVRRLLAERVKELGLRFADRRVIEDTDGKPLYGLFRVDVLGSEELWPADCDETRPPS